MVRQARFGRGRRPWRGILGFVLCVSLLAASIGVRAEDAGPAPLPPPLSPPPDFAPEMRAQLVPREFTELAGELAGRIDHINTKIGDHFKKGDVLVVFDCSIENAAVAKARATATQADKTYAINQRLLALKSIGELELEVSAAEVGKSRADLAAAEATQSKCTIVAPFTGVTVDQKAREFQYAAPGQALLDIIDDRDLDVEFVVPSRWLAWLKPGYTFQVEIGETGKSYPARVTRLGGRVDAVSQSIRLFGEITAAAPELMAGMSGKVDIAPPK
jgi:RND family efflux transporter MFP subunit